MSEFPKGFFWGAATSAYQVEGNNANSDWWDWEKQADLKDVSGGASRHYEHYREDFDLAKALCHNAHRFSIEWSRIEPEQGKFSQKEINHYKDVVLSLRRRNLEPIVTLHHFTNPVWFSKLGGWRNKDAAGYFIRYLKEVVKALSQDVNYWVTINEPLVYTYYSYILGVWPPEVKSFKIGKLVTNNLALAHIRAYKAIHKAYRESNLSLPFVGIAKNLQAFSSCKKTFRNRFAVYLRNRFFNHNFIQRLVRKRSLDFIGINYYTQGLVDVKGWGIKNLLLDRCDHGCSNLKKNSLGWDIYPQGLYELLSCFKKYNLPLFILENGICTEDDKARWDFIYEHLKSVQQAIIDGAEVLGYIYWSLLDNYEWDKGFNPRFGLIEVDYSTYKRKIKESAKRFAEVCKTGRLG